MHKISTILLTAALCLTACAQPAARPTPPGPATADRGDAILANASTAAAIADAVGLAPPSTLGQRTTIDEKGVRIAFATADATATIIDSLVANGQIVRNTPVARRLKAALLAVRSGLIAASAAQRAGNATSYRDALVKAQVAVSEISAALAR